MGIILSALKYLSPAHLLLCSKRHCSLSTALASTFQALKPFLFLFQINHKIQAFESLEKHKIIWSSCVQTFYHDKIYSLCGQPTRTHTHDV